MMARVIGSPGACAGFFTYRAPPANQPLKVQEIDIEILTQDPRNAIQLTNQPSTDKDGNAVAESTVNATTPDDVSWSDWNIYRMDWMPKMSSWYFNGVPMANISYHEPKNPSGLIINMWGDGGVWTGVMPVNDSAYMQIQWIDLVFNTSGKYDTGKKMKRDGHGPSGGLTRRGSKKGCAVVCSIDEVDEIGTPAVMYNNTGTAAVGWRQQGMGAMAVFPLLFAASLAFGFL
jgi:beta-glucanase (GH16 family)